MSHGGSTANPVLLVHGFATSALRTWQEPGWIDLLQEAGRRVIAPDLLGHGDAPKPHDVEAYSNVEQLVLDQLPPDQQVDAIGYSAGARIVLWLASQYPDRFGRVVVGGMGERIFVRREGNPILDALENKTGADDVVGAHFRSMSSANGNDIEALKAFIARDQPRLDREHIAMIDAPVLVAIGDADFAGPGDGLAEALPNGSLLTLPGVDHFGLPKNFTFLEKSLDFLGAAPSW